MPSSIRPTRSNVSDRFPVAGFNIHTGGPGYFEVAVATDPSLFQTEHQGDRNDANFYSTRGVGPLPAEGGDAVYLLPQNVLARFTGHDRLYYTLATFLDANRANPDVLTLPSGVTPSIVIARGFSGRRTAIGVPNVRGGLTGSSYGSASRGSLTWAGDMPAPGKSQPVAVAPAKMNGTNGKAAVPTSPSGSTATPAAAAKASGVAQAVDAAYDDGYGPLPTDGSGSSQDDGPGIEGPIPDAAPAPSAQAYARPMEASEYPQASRFVPAATSNYRTSSSPRAIHRIVIHITDGGAKIDGPISWFQNPRAGVSAHYIVGQDGEVVQMVHHNDVAWHAHTANGDSIGIEHVANTHGLMPTEAQYCASAALVNWLCTQLGIDMNRTNILGHSEADPKTTHTGCPNAVWDWDYYMSMVTSGVCHSRAATQSLAVKTAKAKPLNWATAHPKAKTSAYSTRALDDDSDSDDGGYFKDADKLTTYLQDERAADTVTVSSKADAKAIIQAFKNNTAASPWTTLDRGQVANRLLDLIEDPRLIQQGALNLCGPAVFFCMWNGRDPVGFAKYACDLFDNGSASIGSMNVAPSNGLLTKDYSQMLPLMGGAVAPQADWMVLGALRNSEDVFWQGTWKGDPRQELPGLTRPEELAAWMKASGVWGNIRNEANWATIKGLPHAIDLEVLKGTDIALLVNENLLVAAHPKDSTCGQATGAMPETNWILKQFPNHFVMLLSEVVHNVQNDELELAVWSWGRTMVCLSVPMNAFRDNYYGAVIGMLPYAAITQGLGLNRERQPKARTAALNGASKRHVGKSSTLAHNIIQPMYTPSNPDEAKRFLSDFQKRRQRWASGVQDTTIYPHSAICRFHIHQDDGDYIGTGFYIDRDLILTCGHNCHDANSITIVPGKNDLASNPEPFGRFDVDSSAWTIHPKYDPNAKVTGDVLAARNFDLAVIRVGTPPPNGWYFPVLEELLVSQPSPIEVCGYAAEDVDKDRQHMDGDQIVAVQDERFDYDIQTTGGSSGSPVFYVGEYDDEQAQQCVMEYRVVGVHTHLGIDPATGTVSQTVNGGCRLTQAKIQWINSLRTVATGQALAAGNGHKRTGGKDGGHKHHHQASTHASVLATDTAIDFDDAAITRMRTEATGNAARATATTDTVTFLNSALRQLYNSTLRNPDGSDKPLGASVQDSLSALQGYGLAMPRSDFEFVDSNGATTRGVARPDHLRDSVEEWIAHEVDPAQAAAWRCFAMSLLDGYHGVILALESGANSHLYWIDQIHGGFDDVTGKADQRIASLTQKWWDPQDANRKPRTRVSLWPLTPGSK